LKCSLRDLRALRGVILGRAIAPAFFLSNFCIDKWHDSYHDIRVKTVKTQIVFPESILEEVDSVVKNRERSEFVVKAVEEKLQRIRLDNALHRAAGIWKDRPDMKTDAQVRKFIKGLRGADTRRQRRLRKAFKSG
jgi:hypothetical protein